MNREAAREDVGQTGSVQNRVTKAKTLAEVHISSDSCIQLVQTSTLEFSRR